MNTIDKILELIDTADLTQSEYRTNVAKRIYWMVQDEIEKTPGGACSNSLSLNTSDYSTVFDTLKDYALKLVANAHSEMSDEQWQMYVNELTEEYATALSPRSEQL